MDDPHFKSGPQKRNRLRKSLTKDKSVREEWLQACTDANEAIKDTKIKQLEEFLTSTNPGDDPGKMWKVIKFLNGTPSTNSPNESINVNGKTIVNLKDKANVFAKHYAAVSRHDFTREERAFHRDLKKKLHAPSVEDQSCAKLTIAELRRAIQKVRGKGAAGPIDDIPPYFLKALGPKALEELLGIFNQSFLYADCPRIWRVATIIPLLKAGKSASEVASFRPVSLTSCVAKLLERILADRLFHIAETKNLFSKLQAGFRRNRSCEDNILRVIQKIEDGFQQKKFHRSVLALLDFSKAYNTVWREKLLDHMISLGIPLQFIRWLRAFLSDRRARVKLNNVFSNSYLFKQGLPQGSVLAPLLFLFYINDLAEHLPEDVLNSLFADDVAILGTARERNDATALVQHAVTIVERWSIIWKIKINVGKC